MPMMKVRANLLLSYLLDHAHIRIVQALMNQLEEIHEFEAWIETAPLRTDETVDLRRSFYNKVRSMINNHGGILAAIEFELNPR